MPTQLLYKYRDLRSLDRFLDIVLRKRLYAAKFGMLNDPMEGIFTYNDDQGIRTFISELTREKRKIRVCSLSKSHNNNLLWSYYADSHQGVALGVRVATEKRGIIKLSKIDYSNSNHFEPFTGSQPDIEAIRVLSRKLKSWRHEEEYRVFTKSSYVPVDIEVLYLGCHVSKTTGGLIRKLMDITCPGVQVLQMQTQDLDRPDAVHGIN